VRVTPWAMGLTFGLVCILPTAAEPQGSLDLGSVFRSLSLLVIREECAPGQGARPGLPRTAWATAFLVTSDGLAVTNHHVTTPVLGGRIRIEAVLQSGQSGRRVQARVVAEDARNDIAVLRIAVPESASTHRLPVSGRVPELLDRIYVCGFPGGLAAAADPSRGPEPAVTRGEVAAVRRDAAGLATQMDLSAVACPGSSGSPVVDDQGTVVGVIWGSRDPYGKFVSATVSPRIADLVSRARAQAAPVGKEEAVGQTLSARPAAGGSTTAYHAPVPAPVGPSRGVPETVVCVVVLAAVLAARYVARANPRH